MSPWLALNHDNYLRHKKLEGNSKKRLIENIFIGNVLSALTGTRVFVDFRIGAEIVSFRQITTIAHNNQFVGFHAEVRTNIRIPQHLGLGKSVSKGFGTLGCLNE